MTRPVEGGGIQKLERGLYAPVPSALSVPFSNGISGIGTQSTEGTPLQPGESENS